VSRPERCSRFHSYRPRPPLELRTAEAHPPVDLGFRIRRATSAAMRTFCRSFATDGYGDCQVMLGRDDVSATGDWLTEINLEGVGSAGCRS
jgi:hypothetical protein